MRYALVMLALAPWLVAASCLASVGPDGKPVAGPLPNAIGAIAPLVPGPWGGALAGAAGILTMIGGIFAKRAVNAAPMAGAVNPVTKLFAERKWLMPILAAGIAAGRGFGLWHIDDTALYTILGALGLPAAGEFINDALEKKAPVSTPS